jgi:hypothetical protein
MMRLTRGRGAVAKSSRKLRSEQPSPRTAHRTSYPPALELRMPLLWREEAPLGLLTPVRRKKGVSVCMSLQLSIWREWPTAQ